MRVEITTIDEEFEKSQVKGFVRTKKGKLERVNPFSRKGEKTLSAFGRDQRKIQKLSEQRDKTFEELKVKTLGVNREPSDTGGFSKEDNMAINELVNRYHPSKDRWEVTKYDILPRRSKNLLEYANKLHGEKAEAFAKEAERRIKSYHNPAFPLTKRGEERFKQNKEKWHLRKKD